MPETLSKSSGAAARLAAARIIECWLQSEDFPDRLLGPEMEDRAFVMELVYGSVRRKRALEWIAAQCANRPIDRKLLSFILVGIYQMVYMDGVAEHAAIHATVEAVRAAGLEYATGFANGVLRHVQRKKEALLEKLRQQPLAVYESHPDLLVKRWTGTFGPVRTAALCHWNNTRPQVTIRPNVLRCSHAELLASLHAAGVEATPCGPAGTDHLEIPHGHRVTELPGFAEGWFVVQDPATAVAVDCLDVRPGQAVLDLCAAPGGKTAALAAALGGAGTLFAMDLHDDRIVLLRSTLTRLGIDFAQVVQANGAHPQSMQKALGDQRFDRILLDVPCSNTGVLRRRPDARWRFSQKRLAGLARMQRALLDEASNRLKDEGLLVYSTCSLEPEEGTQLVAKWLAEHPGFALERESQLFPPESQTDGIYAAALRRTERS